MLPRYITAYWGKARENEQGKKEWHPLAYHNLDVAAALCALLKARPHWLTSLAEISGLTTEETLRRLTITAALHDIGKFAENFQWKIPDLAETLGAQTGNWANSGHGSVGKSLWKEIWHTHNFKYLDDWMQAAVSHHGTPVQGVENLGNVRSKNALSDVIAYSDAIVALFEEPSDDPSARKKYEIWRIAGLVILADWIGSNRDWFPYRAPNLTLEEYWKQTQKQADIAIRQAQLEESPTADIFGLGDLIGSDKAPSPLQAWAEGQTPSGKPQLYIIEDLTGSGKTEAALLLCHRLMRAEAAEGIYWALPSMATANGLYERLKDCYVRMFDTSRISPSLVLAHSARDLNDAFQLSIRENLAPQNIGSDASGQEVSAEASCAAFIAEDRKKTFLAQVGVGTLDQALLGVLPVRHQSLRLIALSRRVLVIDEAHAYDPYVTEGLERLLKFQKALGGSTIILSATLTHDQRQRFAKAYDANGETTQNGFPLTTHVSEGHVTEETHVSKRGTRRDLPYKRHDKPESAMKDLLDKAREGFCGVYIRNTVQEALEAYAYLQRQWPHTDIFHARFCLHDRLKRENEILNRFGKTSSPEGRKGQILVATQVIEQSLDLDFDCMATDLCPIDLLIQRAGRLQRHGHRPERPAPELWVVGAEATDDVKTDWYASLFPKGQYVYPHVGQLWRSMRALQEKGGINLMSGSPRDLIESVFGTGNRGEPEALVAQCLKAEGKHTGDKGIAYLNFLNLKDFTPQKDGWAKDVFTPTRLGDKTITLRLAKWENGELTPWAGTEDKPLKAWRMSEISIRQQRCAKPVAPDANAAEAIKRVTQEWNTRYDPPPILALVPSEDQDVWACKWEDPSGKIIDVTYSSREGLRVR